MTAVGWCPECGPVESYDEDGCCSCGCTCTGPGADKALKLERDALAPTDLSGVCQCCGETVSKDHTWQGCALESQARADEAKAMLVAWTGTACKKCGGRGSRMYGNTSTWRHSMGGASLTEGVCDTCWGTGRSDIIGPDLRIIEAHEAQLEREVSERWLARRLGATFRDMRPHLATIAARLKHKRADDFWLQRCTETVRGVLEHLSKEPTT